MYECCSLSLLLLLVDSLSPPSKTHKQLAISIFFIYIKRKLKKTYYSNSQTNVNWRKDQTNRNPPFLSHYGNISYNKKETNKESKGVNRLPLTIWLTVAIYLFQINRFTNLYTLSEYRNTPIIICLECLGIIS